MERSNLVKSQTASKNMRFSKMAESGIVLKQWNEGMLHPGQWVVQAV